MPATPVAVELRRGATVESRHRVAACVVEVGGRVVARIGEVDVSVFPRSSLKPFQALPLVETGAADALGVSDEELALACASHGGEPMHTTRVGAWLGRLGLGVDDLECGAHAPSHAPSAEALRASGEPVTALHNNCSGKHTGMLATARHLGEPTRGYLAADHPVQRRIRATLEELAGERLGEPGIDGCGVPNWPMRLVTFARLAAASLARGASAARIRRAMRAHPDLVAGTGRLCTDLMRVVPDVVAKTGAEGVFVALLPSRGLALALKVEDGAGRGAEVALLALLQRLVPDPAPLAGLERYARPVVRNVAGAVVGEIVPAAGWPRL
ncbi:MAG: asparaginase [Pseudomonadota bacterium]